MISVSEISRRLAERVADVCLLLLPNGKEVNGEWHCGDVIDSPGKSLKIHLTGGYIGHWRDWADDDSCRGDLLDLWRFVKDSTLAEAIREAKEYLGIFDPALQTSMPEYSRPPERESKQLNPDGEVFKYLTRKRMLEPSILNRFKIDSENNSVVIFPSFDTTGNLINRSFRALQEKAKGKKDVWQEKGCAPAMFGWQALSDEAFLHRKILICEGQIDCMTWTQWGIPSLSIPNGSGGTWINFEWDNLGAFDHIYLSFDPDPSGTDNLQKVIARLGRHRCMVVQLPKKDANDCLKAGCTQADAMQWIASARLPSVKGLVKATDLKQRFLAEISPKPEAFTLPFFKKSWPDEGFYLRHGEVSLWTGVTGHGKSTFLNYLIMALISFKTGVFVASMEVKPETNLRKMATMLFSGRDVTPVLAEGFLIECGELLSFADVVGYIKQNDLMEMMRFSFSRYGTQHFFIDSFMRISGLEEDYPAQGDFMNELAEFSKSTGAHVHLVAHPRKLTPDGKPEIMDVKGNSSISNNADNLVAICRNFEKDKLRKAGNLSPIQEIQMHDTEIIVHKQRESGWTGRFLLKFHPRRLSYSVAK